MIITSLSGKILFQSTHRTMKTTLEEAVQQGVDLSGADLRKAKLSFASLDGMKARGASFWAADLMGADIGLADLRGADMRCTDLKDTCLAETDMSGANLHGAYFCSTLLEETVLDSVAVSCPSFWDCNLQSVKSFDGFVYSHLGEKNVILHSTPIVIRGFKKHFVLLGEYCLYGTKLFKAATHNNVLQEAVFALKTTMDRHEKSLFSRNANAAISKIALLHRGN